MDVMIITGEDAEEKAIKKEKDEVGEIIEIEDD